MADFLTTVAAVLALAGGAPLEAAPAPEPEPFTLRTPAFGQITSTYGPRWGRMHHGIDYGTLDQLAVVAAADGVVKKTGYLPNYGGYGIVILIGHGNGYQTLYAHLSRVRVEVGQPVKEGDWIGVAGSTGSSTGVHLHFELREQGVPVDPMPFITR